MGLKVELRTLIGEGYTLVSGADILEKLVAGEPVETAPALPEPSPVAALPAPKPKKPSARRQARHEERAAA